MNQLSFCQSKNLCILLVQLRDVIQFEEENIDVELSNEKPLNDMPFEIKAASDGKGNYILCINYSGSLKDDEVFLYSINDMDLKFDACEKFDAPMDKIEPIVIQGLTEGKEYILQIRLDSEYLEKSIKGTLTVDNDDFILKGNYQIVNMKYLYSRINDKKLMYGRLMRVSRLI